MITLMVFEERDEHQISDSPQRKNLYVGKNPKIACDLFREIKNGQLVMIGEESKVTLVKKNSIIFIE